MRALMTRKSCAVEMRNAILGNHLKKERSQGLFKPGGDLGNEVDSASKGPRQKPSRYLLGY